MPPLLTGPDGALHLALVPAHEDGPEGATLVTDHAEVRLTVRLPAGLGEGWEGEGEI